VKEDCGSSDRISPSKIVLLLAWARNFLPSCLPSPNLAVSTTPNSSAAAIGEEIPSSPFRHDVGFSDFSIFPCQPLPAASDWTKKVDIC
jgi:hypothetical protein